jgi:hypothetical protein
MNFGKAALQILGTVAPTIATAVGGPVAGLAVQELEKFFGVKGDALDGAIAGATPDQLAQLRKIDNDFKVQMAQIGFDEDKLRFDDTASARAREAAVKDHTPEILAYSTTIGFFGILFWMLVHGVPKESDVLMVMLGSLGTAWTAIVGYYFGSSIGARRNADALAQIAKQP